MKDINGKEWTFRFTARTVRELAAETRLDTKALTGENSLLARMQQDETVLYTVLWITVRPQAEQYGVNENEWFELLDNDALESAVMEWTEAYINFSHPARKLALMKSFEATRKVMDGARAKIEHELKSGNLDRVIEADVEKALMESFSMTSTTSAASSLESSE